MARKIIGLMVILLAAPVWAANPRGAISGTVRNSSGSAQVGARVEFFAGSLAPAATVFTDATGFFQAVNLAPGAYHLKVSAPSFLPAMRDGIGLQAGAHLVIDITLNSLFEALQAVPGWRQSPRDQDDWKWVLRSTANRPVLRMVDDGRPAAEKTGAASKPLNGELAFLAGSGAGASGGSYDMSTAFKMERSLFSSGTLVVGGDVGYGDGVVAPATVVRATYSQPLPDGSEPLVALTLRRLATPQTADHDSALQALAVSAADGIRLGDELELNAGGEYQTIQFMGTMSALRPFGSAKLQVSPQTVLAYQYATSVPTMRPAKGFDSAPADLSESDPRVSLAGSGAVLERAQHHEVSLTRHFGRNTVETAWYRDRISDPALAGAGYVTGETASFLPDIYSGTFTWNGPELATDGVRAVFERSLSTGLTATLDYAYGGVLAALQPGIDWTDLRSAVVTQDRTSVTCKISGDVPQSRTRWLASYQWISGAYALTPVDWFNVSSGQADPYLSVFVRQPIPAGNFLALRMEVLIDIRNLLAQGYVPVAGSGGHTLYLVESARVFRGGLAFTF